MTKDEIIVELKSLGVLKIEGKTPSRWPAISQKKLQAVLAHALADTGAKRSKKKEVEYDRGVAPEPVNEEVKEENVEETIQKTDEDQSGEVSNESPVQDQESEINEGESDSPAEEPDGGTEEQEDVETAEEGDVLVSSDESSESSESVVDEQPVVEENSEPSIEAVLEEDDSEEEEEVSGEVGVGNENIPSSEPVQEDIPGSFTPISPSGSYKGSVYFEYNRMKFPKVDDEGSTEQLLELESPNLYFTSKLYNGFIHIRCESTGVFKRLHNK